MKRGLILLILFIFIVIFLPLTLSIKPTITGYASSQATNVSINVISANAPDLTLIYPENKTYLTNVSLLLNYSATNADTIWYHLDSNNNITITSYIYFNTTQGSHTLYLYANNSQGTNSTSVTFLINSTRFTILYEEYKGSRMGDSNEFDDYSYEDIQNLSSIILENTDFGKIIFLEVINLTDDEDTTDHTLDLDSYTNISSNRIELNSTALQNFNKSATLWLRGLTYTNPRILKDGSVCSSGICTKESYSSNTLKFNVTSFSTYSAEETPSTPTPTPSPGGGGGGGGGGVAVTTKIDFSVEPSLLRVVLRQGEMFNTSIKVKNTGTSSQSFNIETTLEDFILVKDKEFTLASGEEKEIPLIFYALEDTKPKSYTGKIKVSDSTGTVELPVILNLKSKFLLFDVILDIPSTYKEVKPGEKVLLEVSIFNLGLVGKVDVKMKYQIKDFENNIIVEKEEAIEVETQLSLLRDLQLPKDIQDGQYVAVATATYDDSIGTASDIFYVSRVKIRINYIYVIAIVILFILLIIIILNYYSIKLKRIAETHIQELNKIKSRIQRGHLKIAEVEGMRAKLNSQLALLTKAYEKGYIKKNAYKSGRQNILKVHASLKKKYL